MTPAQTVKQLGPSEPPPDPVQDARVRERGEQLGYAYWQDPEGRWHESLGGTYAERLGLGEPVSDAEARRIAAELRRYGLGDPAAWEGGA